MMLDAPRFAWIRRTIALLLLVALWFFRRFGIDPAVIGAIYLGANFFAGLSALAAARVAARYGLEVPVVLVDGKKWTKFRVDEAALERRLAR